MLDKYHIPCSHRIRLSDIFNIIIYIMKLVSFPPRGFIKSILSCLIKFSVLVFFIFFTLLLFEMNVDRCKLFSLFSSTCSLFLLFFEHISRDFHKNPTSTAERSIELTFPALFGLFVSLTKDSGSGCRGVLLPVEFAVACVGVLKFVGGRTPGVVF